MIQQLRGRRGHFESSRVLFLSVDGICPNPNQPRTRFSQEGLTELADSIRQIGILQPLSVRRREGGGYELISGERRLRAAKLAGLREVPCILVRADDMESSLLALVENLQRRDLDFVEEAKALRNLIDTYHLSQEEAAQRVGKSQSAVANKLRLLRLSDSLLADLLEAGLSERHARALLRLEEDKRPEALAYMIKAGLNVAQTEEYVESLLHCQPQKRAKPVILIRDVRLFFNTLTRGVDAMRRTGLEAKYSRDDTEEEIRLTVSIPKTQAIK